jgi:predicted enzyme related to lactoylglutathione lyase
MATVLETFVTVQVADMPRATRFYTTALQASVSHALAFFSSLHVAGVRVGLALVERHQPTITGLHFSVADLDAARADVERAGGRVVAPRVEVAPGVFVADCVDSEGNTFVLALK